jgi:hypothetical protein
VVQQREINLRQGEKAMLLQNSPKTIAVIYFALTLGTQNPAIALVNQPISSSRLVSVNTNTQKTKQPILVAQNATYSGTKRDFKIFMPGIVTKNTDKQLILLCNNT